MRQLKKEEEELVELLKKEGEEWRQIEEEMEQMKVRAGWVAEEYVTYFNFNKLAYVIIQNKR